ncbi:hypothetical protein C8R47DRAFT_980677 [Mycena vitilis]|nr:hypothetical protein C8R47DRAFT_980677 [Mycena vitilis]
MVTKHPVKSKDRPLRIFELEDAEQKHMCLVSALAHWLSVAPMDDDPDAPLFRKINLHDTVLPGPLDSATFLEWYRSLLAENGADPELYGVHSLRRGGFQYLYIDLDWNLHKVAAWGGWSEKDFQTIIKYLISRYDDDKIPREDFLDPTKKIRILCPHCQRSCPCNQY